VARHIVERGENLIEAMAEILLSCVVSLISQFAYVWGDAVEIGIFQGTLVPLAGQRKALKLRCLTLWPFKLRDVIQTLEPLWVEEAAESTDAVASA
jgi:hypothetical protein